MGFDDIKLCSIFFSKKGNGKMELEYATDLIIENGASFVILHTNITNRPIKLLLDTGAALTLIVSDLIKSKVSFNAAHRTNLHGMTTSIVDVQTYGTVHVILSFEDNNINMKMHVIDKKYAVQGDGYLGFDFMYQFNAKIDMPTRKLFYHSNSRKLEEKKNE